MDHGVSLLRDLCLAGLGVGAGGNTPSTSYWPSSTRHTTVHAGFVALGANFLMDFRFVPDVLGGCPPLLPLPLRTCLRALVVGTLYCMHTPSTHLDLGCVAQTNNPAGMVEQDGALCPKPPSSSSMFDCLPIFLFFSVQAYKAQRTLASKTKLEETIVQP